MVMLLSSASKTVNLSGFLKKNAESFIFLGFSSWWHNRLYMYEECQILPCLYKSTGSSRCHHFGGIGVSL